TFSGNEATKKTNKNLLKQQYGNFKAEASETLEQTFNRLQRNMSDLDTMSLDDLYNHLKVYESEVQKKSESNSQNMAFISSAKHSSGNEEVNIASVSTASTNVECFNCHKMGHFVRECRAPRSQDRGRRDNYRQGSKVEEQAPKALMAIDGVGWDWSYMANDEENHALVADEEAPTDFALMAKTSAKSKNKEGLGYSAVTLPPAQFYSPPKKDLYWKGLLEFADDTVTDYSRPLPDIESTSDDAKNRNSSDTETEASPSTISPKPFIKFVKATDRTPRQHNMYSIDLNNIIPHKDLTCLVAKASADEYDANILLRTPRQHNMYSIDLNNIVSHKDLTCLVAKASADECMLWHRGLGHLNFKTMNKLVRHNLVRGLPTKCFENDHTCTACLKGKQHKASLTDDFSRFTWTFFLESKDETNGILKKFITEIENLKDLKVKIIRRNRTLIEAARTLLADAKLPVPFWAEAVNTACYVQTGS
nr:hypothetical protein [Tanacetum cinerariifolium]